VISVIIPVYNAARYLNWAIESILAQSHRDFEVIAVDDGSTDNSRQILERFASRDSRLRLVSRANTGIVGALNDGLLVARGEFIVRMDADDISLPDRFEQQLTFMKAHPDCVALGTDVFYTDPEGNPLIRHYPAEDHERILDQLLDGNGGAMIHPSAMFRRSAVEEAGGYDPRYQWSEDLDLYLRLSKIGRLANLRDVHLHYRQHFGSVNKVHPDRDALRLELVNSRRAALGMAPLAIEAPGKQPSFEPEWRRHWAYDAARGGNWRSARWNARKAFLSAPFDSENWRCLKYALLTGPSRSPFTETHESAA